MEDAPELESAANAGEAPEADEAPAVPLEPAVPITSRFLYVDVAALRAKQLRRGARVRFDIEPGTLTPHKPERVVMEEVKRRLVQYTVPPWKSKVEEHA